MGDLPPGRDLDAHAARVVMGYEEVHKSKYPGRDIVGRLPGPKMALHELPHYSTDTAAAFELVDKVTEPLDWLVEISLHPPGYGGIKARRWFCRFARKKTKHEGYGLEFHDALADTRPHAITLAACKAAEARGDG